MQVRDERRGMTVDEARSIVERRPTRGTREAWARGAARAMVRGEGCRREGARSGRATRATRAMTDECV